MEIPITQSKEWEALQQDLGEPSFYREEKDYQYLAIKKNIPGGCYLYAPYGPVASSSKDFKAALKSLQDLAKQENAVFIRIEPRNPDFSLKIPKNLMI